MVNFCQIGPLIGKKFSKDTHSPPPMRCCSSYERGTLLSVIDYRINGYSYPNIYAEELEYDESSDEFWKTGRNIVLRSSEVERDYKNDYGTEIKIVW